MGPNKVPVNALVVFALVTFVFIAIGQINTLAPIVTIPFLLTYVFVEYAYFSLSMTYDLQKEREARFSKPIYDSKGVDEALLASPSFDLRKDKGFTKQFITYGSTSKEGKVFSVLNIPNTKLLKPYMSMYSMVNWTNFSQKE